MAELTRELGEVNGMETQQRSGPGASVVVLSTGQSGAGTRMLDTSFPSTLETQLEEAEALIKYAANVGIDIEQNVQRDVIVASMTPRSTWTPETATSLLAALTKLSDKLRPVSGSSLRKCVIEQDAAQTIEIYRRLAKKLFWVIVPFSVLAFVASTTCNGIRADIEAADQLVVTLALEASRARLPSNPTAFADDLEFHGVNQLKNLNELAARIRAVEGRARVLGLFWLHWLPQDGFDVKPRPEDGSFSEQTFQAIEKYQLIRYRAQNTQENVSMTFGAFTSCVLPILYALLGACAYLLRLFERQLNARTFTGAEKPAARFRTAAISGLVVGLFANLLAEHGPVLPPLALAFLVGYGVDVFFVFLDGLLQAFGRTQPEARQP